MQLFSLFFFPPPPPLSRMAPEVILAMDEGTYNGKVRDFKITIRNSDLVAVGELCDLLHMWN